jgi:hypothetical protein
LLTNDIGDQIAIKSGFSSGYLGEGPTRFSYVLQFLYAYGAKIDECIVDEAIVARLDNSALTVSDLEKINAVKPVRANRWRNYVLERHENALDRRIWAEFPHVIPFAVIDSRTLDLTLSFWANPDDKLLKAYRRLEDAVRERTA